MKINSHFTLSILSGLTGAIVVMAGAFGAHALEDLLMEAGMTDVWETATMYGLVHASLAALWVRSSAENILPAWFWLTGVWLFSGSLLVFPTHSIFQQQQKQRRRQQNRTFKRKHSSSRVNDLCVTNSILPFSPFFDPCCSFW